MENLLIGIYFVGSYVLAWIVITGWQCWKPIDWDDSEEVGTMAGVFIAAPITMLFCTIFLSIFGIMYLSKLTSSKIRKQIQVWKENFEKGIVG